VARRAQEPGPHSDTDRRRTEVDRAGQEAPKFPDLVTRSLDPTGKGRHDGVMRWKPALNAFAVTFEGRIDPAGN
jgi:hypothetical protein